jgi:hypothetical protein
MAPGAPDSGSTWPADPGAPPSPGVIAQLPTRAADAVDLVVDTIFDRFIRPVILVARWVVFGLVVAAMAVILLTLLSIALIRLLDVYVFPGKVWASYFLLGFLFCVGGLLLWTQRTEPQSER